MNALFRFLIVPAAFASAPALADFSCATLDPHRVEVAVVETTLGGVPATLRVPPKISKAPIVLWHGFGPPASETALMQALPLDDVPAIKVYLGLPLFGKRAEAGGVDALKRRQERDVALDVFEPIVAGAAKELPRVVAALRVDGCIHAREKIGLFGFSAGGAAVLYALAERDVPIGAAVVVNASTGLGASVAAYEHATGKSYAWSEASRALAKRTDAPGRAADIAKGDPPPAVLIIQGTADTMLTPELATALDKALAPRYAQANAKDRERFALATELTHDISNNRDVRMWSGEWFTRFLDSASR
ncbi:MAG: prolyl oligopeptidase family serine peptidase [Rhodanobacteraceae bacterium]